MIYLVSLIDNEIKVLNFGNNEDKMISLLIEAAESFASPININSDFAAATIANATEIYNKISNATDRPPTLYSSFWSTNSPYLRKIDVYQAVRVPDPGWFFTGEKWSVVYRGYFALIENEQTAQEVAARSRSVLRRANSSSIMAYASYLANNRRFNEDS